MKNSTESLIVGGGGILASFCLPTPLAVPALAVSVASFIRYELAIRHEKKYLKPVEKKEHELYLKRLDHKYEYKLGVNQAIDQNQIDWKARQTNKSLNMGGSVEDKYFALFTAGRPQPQPSQQPISFEVQQPSQPQRQELHQQEQQEQQAFTLDFSGAADLPEGSVELSQIDQVPELRLESFEKTAFLLIWGCQGSGKTTLAKRIARMRESRGHSITVADPHGSKVQWSPWGVVGSGRDYEKLDEFLADYDSEITTDYEAYSIGKTNFPSKTLIVDEFTAWSDHCSNAPKFVKSACSDIRKINKCVLMISHTDTLTGLGNAAGMKAAIDRSAVKLELEAEIDLDCGEYIATGFGWLQYPGRSRQRVKIPAVPLGF